MSKKRAKKAKKDHARSNGARAQVREHDAHVLVCKGSDCKKRGSKDIRKALKAELRGRGKVGDVRVDAVDCLGLCKHGPNVVVHPGGTWYLGLRVDDVPQVVEQHLEGNAPVERLAAGFRPRKKRG